MSARERTILIVMGLVVLFGAYTLFFSGSKKGGVSASGGRTGELNRMITSLAVELSKEGPTEVDKYITERAEAGWGKDPLFEKKVSLTKEKIKIPDVNIKKSGKSIDVLPDMSFTYSGYLEMGRVKIAIINGLEYEAGDEIVGGEYIVQTIYPNKVEIAIKGSEGKKGKVTVPIEEEIL
ncbi:hypothetical protein ACFL2O_04510 [Thermodesulfobacteriota bacterium]